MEMYALRNMIREQILVAAGKLFTRAIECRINAIQ
jgi:hypothetical protein